MKPMTYVLILLILLFVAAQAYVRLSPTDPSAWHVDPFTATTPGDRGYLLLPGPGGVDADGRSPQALLAALAKVAADTPRTKRVIGDPETGRITWETRSAFWGFPDYTTAATRPGPDGEAEIAILARSRFGSGDFGVNRARVNAWVEALEAAQ